MLFEFFFFLSSKSFILSRCESLFFHRSFSFFVFFFKAEKEGRKKERKREREHLMKNKNFTFRGKRCSIFHIGDNIGKRLLVQQHTHKDPTKIKKGRKKEKRERERG